MGAENMTAGGVDTRRVGTVAIVGGAAFAFGALGSMATEWAWVLMLVGLASLIYVVPMVHRMEDHRDSWPGAMGAWLVPAGAGLVVALGIVAIVLDATGTMTEGSEPAWVEALWMIGFFSFLVGTVLFCVGAMKAHFVTPIAPLLMMVGLVASVGIDMLTGAFFGEATTEYGLYIGVPIVGLGLAWMGYQLTHPERLPGHHGVVAS